MHYFVMCCVILSILTPTFAFNFILKELEGKKKYAHDLQKVANEPAMGNSDLDELNKRVSLTEIKSNFFLVTSFSQLQ